MLAAEHEAAEVLRHQRLKAYGLRRSHGHHLGWLWELFGFARAR